MAVSVLAMSITTLATGRYSFPLSSRGLVRITALASFGAGLVILGLFPTLYTTLLGVIMLGAGVGGSSPPLLALLGDISSEDQIGKLGGVYNVFGDLGATLGPVVTFPVGAAIGYDRSDGGRKLEDPWLCSGRLKGHGDSRSSDRVEGY